MRTRTVDISFSNTLSEAEIDEYIQEIRAFAGVSSVEERKARGD